MIQLRNALQALIPIKSLCSKTDLPPLKSIADQINPCDEIKQRLFNELIDDPPNQVNKGNVIKKGTSQELDDLRDIAYSGKDYLLKIQQSEIERTGISSLKIGFNNVFGYYFEVRNTHKDKVPAEWIRKQTLVNAERYITEELKEYYIEFKEFDNYCRFIGCNHINEPDCAIKDALKDNKISETRYKNYNLLYEELKAQKKY